MTLARAPQPHSSKTRAGPSWVSLAQRCSDRLRSLKPIPSGLCASERLDEELARAIQKNDQLAFDNALGALSLRSPPKPPFGPHSRVILLPEPSRALALALEFPRPLYLERLLAAGADPNAKTLARAGLPAGAPLLFRAVALNQPQLASLLLSYGADIAFRDEQGQNALMLAARLGLAEMARSLIQAKSPLDERDKSHQSALQLALPYLARQDPLCAGPSAKKTGPALLARLSAGGDIAMALLEAGASAAAPPLPVSPFHHSPLPPLASAIRLGHARLIQRLLDADADAQWLQPDPPAVYALDNRPVVDWARKAQLAPETVQHFRFARSRANERFLDALPPEVLLARLAELSPTDASPPEAPSEPPREPSPAAPRAILASWRSRAAKAKAPAPRQNHAP